MKPSLRNLRRGERVWALIEECLERREVIVNFGGDLIRIANESNKGFRPGQRVLLEVQSTHPFQFKLITSNVLEGRTHRHSLDVSI